ncbi:hypothetical protein QYE76_008547 [Lolium multiflorum]|uniref:Transposase n=1 Tax=Lolium multiflorum TaxID=4521 RepID=A0AAD8X0Z9_LOLMU|nr:hypothetical protein QYE76_008547 [Lolium multiflorum]
MNRDQRSLPYKLHHFVSAEINPAERAHAPRLPRSPRAPPHVVPLRRPATPPRRRHRATPPPPSRARRPFRPRRRFPVPRRRPSASAGRRPPFLDAAVRALLDASLGPTAATPLQPYDAAPAASWTGVWACSGPDADDGGPGLGSAGQALGGVTFRGMHLETMDADKDEVQEELMANLIASGRDADVTAHYLNDSGEGAMDIERRKDDGSGEEEDNGSSDGTLVITKSTEPSESSHSSVKSKRGPAKKLSEGVRFDIVEIVQDGRPTAPDKAAKLFISQCGVVVRDCIPITVREWHKPKAEEAEEGHYVDDVAKNNLWRRLMAHFTLPPEENLDRAKKMEEKVKEFALKKMAKLFKNHKKRLYQDFVKQKKTSDFTGAYEQIKDHWPEFVKYKLSDEFKKRSETNKANAALKKYHQVMGPGGYRANRPKWQKAEAELIRRGIQIETFDWTERSKEWFYGIGGKLDPETGKCIYNKEHLKKPCEALIAAHKEVREGMFHPERENDEMTQALGNKEHGG